MPDNKNRDIAFFTKTHKLKRDFTYLRELTKIARTNGIYQKLLGKQNLACVRAFLASIDDKVK